MNEFEQRVKGELWDLRLYVNGQSKSASIIIETIHQICRKHINSIYTLEVIDLAEQPESGAADRILALPTLVRRAPQPLRKIIGDLTNTEKILIALNLCGMATQAQAS